MSVREARDGGRGRGQILTKTDYFTYSTNAPQTCAH